MAQPTPDPAAPQRSITRRARLIDAGLEAVSLSMLGFVAIGLLIHGGRREISRDLAQAWLSERGIDAVITVDDLDASGFSGSVLLGPRNDPIFAAERIEVAYDLAAPWSGGAGQGFAIETRAIRLVRPRLKASLTDKGLNFGPLQALIDEALQTPREPSAEGPAIVVENARLDLKTAGGLARITGDASLDDGKLLRFDGRLARMRYATGDLVVEARGALIGARKRGERLTVTARFDLETLTRSDLDLSDAQGQIEADLAYPDLVALSAVGPAQIRAAVQADSARLGTVRSTGLAADLTLAGQMDGTLARGGFDGRLSGRVRQDTLSAPGLNARDVDLNLALSKIDAAKQGDRLAVRASGSLTGDADQTLAGGVAVRGASARIDTAGLILSIAPDDARISGPLAVQIGAGRLASGGLALTSLAANARGRIAGPLSRPILTLAGAGGADSGISGPDAQRLTAFVPDPAQARAAARALESFDLRVPAFDLTVGEGGVVLGLPRPIILTTIDGVSAQVAARGSLLEMRGGLVRGGLAASLSGGGLPSLTLDAPDWRLQDGALNARLVLSGDQINVAPLEGVAGKVAGLARLSDGRFTFALAGCAPLAAKRILVGETPLSAPRGELCPDKAPLISAANGAWTVAARFKAMTTALDEAEARIGDVAGTLTAGGNAGGQMRAAVTLDQGVLTDAAAARRFNPIRTQGRLALSNGLWSGAIDARTPVGQPLGRITLRHDVAQARGRAEIDASQLAFVKDGLQPVDLSPMAAFAKNAAGAASFTGLFVWDADGMTSQGRLEARQIDFTSPIGFVATLDGGIDFVSLTPLVSAPDQSLKITRIDSIVPLQAFAAAFSLGAEALNISSAAFEAAKGRISIEPISVSLDPDQPIRGVIVVEHLDLGELIAASSLVEKVQLNAVVDGRLPFEFSAKGLRFLDGKIRAIQPGRLAISRAALTSVQAGQETAPGAPPAAAAPVNAIQDFAYQAMENLSFDTLEAGVNSTDQGRLAILFHIKGEHDPKVAEKARIGLLDLIRGSAFNKRIALPAKTPVDLTLDTSLNFDELLEAWRRLYETPEPTAPRSAPVQP